MIIAAFLFILVFVAPPVALIAVIQQGREDRQRHAELVDAAKHRTA